MKLVSKTSNYVGQAKGEEKVNQYLLSVDKDLQNLWRVVNTLTRMVGTENASLTSDSNLGYSYIPTVTTAPVGTPTAYTGHNAIAFCNSNSTLYVYNTSSSGFTAIT